MEPDYKELLKAYMFSVVQMTDYVFTAFKIPIEGGDLVGTKALIEGWLTEEQFDQLAKISDELIAEGKTIPDENEYVIPER